MRASFFRISAIPLGLFCFVGAGCISTPSSTQVAEPFPSEPSFAVVSPKNGFGSLPTIKAPTSQASITLAQPLPALPTTVTVLRLKPGTPTGIALGNLAAAISLPSGMLGSQPQAEQLTIDWTNDQQFHWTYQAAERELTFVQTNAPTQPYTVNSFPANDLIVRIANDFLSTHSMSLFGYRDGSLEPDWNGWWYRSKLAGSCMDAPMRDALRARAALPDQSHITPPTLPSARYATCVDPEFPARVMIRYRRFADQQDIVNPDGSGIRGIELLVDVAHQSIVSGKIDLVSDPDRSDYPAISAVQAAQSLLHGGISGVDGTISISGYSRVLLRVQDSATPHGPTYFIPSLLAVGTRTAADGSTSETRIVVPLLAQP